MALQSIDRRRIGLFDFDGTGMTAGLDADPADYEIDTGTLGFDSMLPGTAIRVFGFVNTFGAAPPDFDGRTVVQLSGAHAKLGISWWPNGTVAPFLSLGPDGLVPDIENSELGLRHHINIGGVRIDLTTLPAAPVIIPGNGVRTRFAILQGHRVQMFRSFDRFVKTLGELLDGSTVALGLHAHGAYDQSANVLAARTIGIRLSGSQ